ncbi:hypothetical protein F5X99DRAFT_405973 [Biscogniauxia marginata]|nr:hypothetical protein F5X99DRAFT_405973 [Biscogniauxia marginata]
MIIDSNQTVNYSELRSINQEGYWDFQNNLLRGAMWSFIAATFPPFWRAILIVYLVRAHLSALVSATRLALRVYLATLGLGLVAIAAAGLRCVHHSAIATTTMMTMTTTLPARSLGFWVAWYALVLLGCRRASDGALVAAAALLGWALAQPDVLRMLDFGLAYLGATGLVYDGVGVGSVMAFLRNMVLVL